LARVSQFEKETPIILSLVLLITVATMAIEINEIHEVETFPDYTDNIAPYLATCDPLDVPEKRGALKWMLICASDKWLGNERIIPFAFSIVLIPITYGFITQLTGFKTVGLLTVLVLVTSGIYIDYNTTSTYEQSWVVFLLLSMWLALRGHPVWMTIMFVLAFMAKPLALIYLFPMVAMILIKKPQSHQYSLAGLTIVLLFIIIGFTMLGTSNMSGGSIEFNQDELIAGFYNWWFYLSSTILIAVTIPLIIIKLAHLSKSKDGTAQTILIFLLGIILSVSLIDGFTTQLNHVYRFTPLAIFAGAGLAYILWNFITMRANRFYVKYHLEKVEPCLI